MRASQYRVDVGQEQYSQEVTFIVYNAFDGARKGNANWTKGEGMERIARGDHNRVIQIESNRGDEGKDTPCAYNTLPHASGLYAPERERRVYGWRLTAA